MILVTVGSSHARFDRLLEAIEALGGDEPIFVQHGPSPVRPLGAECVDFLPYDDLVQKIKEARVVVTHAGVGSVMLALSCARRPVVVPRQHRYGEAVDDHQERLARRLEAAGLVTLVDDPEHGLVEAIVDAGQVDAVAVTGGTRLARDLARYLHEHVAT